MVQNIRYTTPTVVPRKPNHRHIVISKYLSFIMGQTIAGEKVEAVESQTDV